MMETGSGGWEVKLSKKCTLPWNLRVSHHSVLFSTLGQCVMQTQGKTECCFSMRLVLVLALHVRAVILLVHPEEHCVSQA